MFNAKYKISQQCTESMIEETVEFNSQLTKNRQNLVIDKICSDNYYKYNHQLCICDNKLIDDQNDGQNLEKTNKTNEFSVPLETPNQSEKYLCSKQIFNGIQCSECYLKKQIAEFPRETEIPTYTRTRWEITRRKLNLYRHHCAEELVKPMIRDPCCWLACLWCFLCICPRCYPI